MKPAILLVTGILAFALFFNCNAAASDSSSSNTITDIDGNVYHTVAIGSQTWTMENLKTTKLNDGTVIANITDSTAWNNSTAPAYCWYTNDSVANKNTYGALYNWFAVHSAKLAPSGWHVPSDTDWNTLESYLIAHGYNYNGYAGVNNIAKSLAAKSNWSASDYEGVVGSNLRSNNKSGFSALPGGYRITSFGEINYYGAWWSTTEEDSTFVHARRLVYNSSDFGLIYEYKINGLSVRLVKDK